MKDQMVFARCEMKYLISKRDHDRLKELMKEYMIPDEYGKSTIQSLYFDTPDDLLVRRSIEGPLYKEKIRLRSYGIAMSDSPVYMEIKKKSEGIVYKRRFELKEKEAERYIRERTRDIKLIEKEKENKSQIEKEMDFAFFRYKGLKPKVLLSYEREAFYEKDDPDFRITFDSNILYRQVDLDLKSGIYGDKLLGEGEVLMEVKAGAYLPMWLVRFLSANRIYKTSFSKYGSAYRMITKEFTNGGKRHYA